MTRTTGNIFTERILRIFLNISLLATENKEECRPPDIWMYNVNKQTPAHLCEIWGVTVLEAFTTSLISRLVSVNKYKLVISALAQPLHSSVLPPPSSLPSEYRLHPLVPSPLLPPPPSQVETGRYSLPAVVKGRGRWGVWSSAGSRHAVQPPASPARPTHLSSARYFSISHCYKSVNNPAGQTEHQLWVLWNLRRENQVRAFFQCALGRWWPWPVLAVPWSGVQCVVRSEWSTTTWYLGPYTRLQSYLLVLDNITTVSTC